MPLCPGNALIAVSSGSFALYLLSVLVGRHDDADLISLTRRAVHNPNPSMNPNVLFCERRALSQKTLVFETLPSACQTRGHSLTYNMSPLANAVKTQMI